MKKNLFFAKYIGRAIAMPKFEGHSTITFQDKVGGGILPPPPRLNYGHTDTPVKLGLMISSHKKNKSVGLV